MDFNPEQHRYSKDGKTFLSVSEFLDRFQDPFAKGLLAQRTAQKEGREAEDVMRQWDLNSEISCDYGNAVHKAIEYRILFGPYSKVPHLHYMLTKFEEIAGTDLRHIKPEIIVSSEDYLLAGTIDQLHRLGEKKVKVVDIKTGDIEKKPHGYFRAPIDKLPCSKLNRYRLQLSTYKHLLELKGFEVAALELWAWNGNEFKVIELEPIDVAPLCQTLVGGSGTNIHSKKIVRI